jgi:hypothetical protein
MSADFKNGYPVGKSAFSIENIKNKAITSPPSACNFSIAQNIAPFNPYYKNTVTKNYVTSHKK